MAQNSYDLFKRRPFKYNDEFEYASNNVVKKVNPEVDSSCASNQSKRKRKATSSTSNNEGAKRNKTISTPSLSENKKTSSNQGRWTCLEHFKFLEALKLFGKEWQKVQKHVFTRTSAQARSHAQKFFAKLEKNSLTLEEFLKDLDIEEVKQTLLAAGNDNTDYDEEREVNMVVNKKLSGSVMNIALPTEGEDKKRNNSANTGKRFRAEVDTYQGYENKKELNNPSSSPQKRQAIRDEIKKAFDDAEEQENMPSHNISTKRFKTSEAEEYGELVRKSVS